MITINRSLNLVVPLERGDGTKIYVHSAPIGMEVFERYHLVLAKTFSSFAENGVMVTSAPSIAHMVMKGIAQNTGRAPGLNWWDGPDGVGGEGGLLAEIVRLSNVLGPSGDGWASTPLQMAFDSGRIDAEEKAEVLSLLVFFTVASRVPPRADRERLVRGMAAIYELEPTSLNATDFGSSLRTRTIAENTGESPAA